MAPVVVVVDNDKDKEDDGVILSGVSAVVGIVPGIVVVDDDNDEEGDGIILSGISIVVGIIASQQAVAVTKLSLYVGISTISLGRPLIHHFLLLETSLQSFSSPPPPPPRQAASMTSPHLAPLPHVCGHRCRHLRNHCHGDDTHGCSSTSQSDCCVFCLLAATSSTPAASCHAPLAPLVWLVAVSSIVAPTPPVHRHLHLLEKRCACRVGLSTRPPPSSSSLYLATFDCCVIVVVVVVVFVVCCPSSGRHHLLLFVRAASAIILQQTTLTSSLLPLLPPPFYIADCCVGVGLMGASTPLFSLPSPPPPLSWQRPGVSAVVGILPIAVVVNDDKDKEYNGNIVSGISVIVGIVASRRRGCCCCRPCCSRALFDCCVFLSLLLSVVVLSSLLSHLHRHRRL